MSHRAPVPYNTSLVVGAGLSIIAALLHVACVFGGRSIILDDLG